MMNYVSLGWNGATVTTLTTISTNASGIYVAFGIQVPATRTLDKVRLYFQAKTGSPLSGDCRLDIYDSVAGLPNASIGGTTLTATPVSAAWNEWTGLNVVLSGGVQYWLVYRNLNSAPTSNHVTLFRSGSTLNIAYSNTFLGNTVRTSTDSGATWAASVIAGGALYRADFTDGLVLGFPLQGAGASAVGTGVYAARRLGNYFVTPSGCSLQLIGIAMPLSRTGSPTGNVRFEVYAGTTLVASTSEIDKAIPVGSTLHHAMLATPYTLSPSTAYRIVAGEVAVAEASSNRYNSLIYTTDNTSLSKSLIPFGWQQTYFDGSSWAETDSLFIPIVLLLDPTPPFIGSGGVASGPAPRIGSPFIRGVN